MRVEKSPLRCDITSEQTPPSKRATVFSDRYIPSQTKRAIDFSIFADSSSIQKEIEKKDNKSNEPDPKNCFVSINEKQYNLVYKSLITNELSDIPKENFSSIDDHKTDSIPYQSPLLFSYKRGLHDNGSVFTTSPSSPFSHENQKILQKQIHKYRKIANYPFKVLDAPDLPNDFYLNLLDWSKNDIVAVALGSRVYLWESSSSRVINLMETFHIEHNITCVKWCKDYPHILAFATNNGMMYLYDVVQFKCVDKKQIFSGQRVGCIEWNGVLISTGSRDGIIRSFELKSNNQLFSHGSHGHSLEVCGLRWDPTGKILASGGNDNKIFLWDIQQEVPIYCLNGHQGAVKALAWSPHDPSLLASGGGSADRCIKFWNTKTNLLLKSLDTQSQVCNLHWSTADKEILSTHGFSSNSINLWTYPSLDQLVSLKGHTSRVIYFSVSPDEEKIVTGSSDETLRFWNVFRKNQSKTSRTEMDCFAFGGIR